MTVHAPLPWRFIREGEKSSCNQIVDSNKSPLCGDETYYPWAPDPEDMAFIVRACNVHYELLAALKNAKAEIISEIDPNTQTAILLNEIDTVIAKAEGTSNG